MLLLRNCRLAVLVGAIVTISAAQAVAQTEQNNYEAGKSPAELFASDCGICHKSPAGLSKVPGLFGLESFLREHYTASRSSAAILAKYLEGIDAAQRAEPAPKGRRVTRSKESETGDKKRADKPVESKSESKSESKGESKSGAKKESKAESASDKSSEKPEKKSDKKSGKKDAAGKEKKSSDKKKSEPAASEAKSSDVKPAEAAKPAAAGDKPAKSD